MRKPLEFEGAIKKRLGFINPNARLDTSQIIDNRPITGSAIAQLLMNAMGSQPNKPLSPPGMRDFIKYNSRRLNQKA